MIVTKKPIYIGRGCIILLSVYRYEREKDEGLFPLDLSLEEDVLNAHVSVDERKNLTITATSGAMEFIKQLRGKWTPRFLKALRNEIDDELKKYE